MFHSSNSLARKISSTLELQTISPGIGSPTLTYCIRSSLLQSFPFFDTDHIKGQLPGFVHHARTKHTGEMQPTCNCKRVAICVDLSFASKPAPEIERLSNLK